MQEILVPVCVSVPDTPASSECPEGYALTHVTSIPFGAGEIDAEAGSIIFGACAFMLVLGMSIALLKKVV